MDFIGQLPPSMILSADKQRMLARVFTGAERAAREELDIWTSATSPNVTEPSREMEQRRRTNEHIRTEAYPQLTFDEFRALEDWLQKRLTAAEKNSAAPPPLPGAIS